jgi:hypothetical protein
MTKEEVIAMSRKAGFMLRSESVDGESDWWECFDEEIESFAKLVVDDYNNKHSQLWQVCIEDVVKAEREACAKVCYDMVFYTGYDCAAAIRARGSV